MRCRYTRRVHLLSLACVLLCVASTKPDCPQSAAADDDSTSSRPAGAEKLIELRYSAKCGKEPSGVDELRFSASPTGTATVRQGILHTTDRDANQDGKYYTLPAAAVRIDNASNVELKFTVRVVRSTGSRTATSVELPLTTGNARLGPFTKGGHGEGYQDVVYDGCLLAIGFVSDGVHHERDEVLVIDGSRTGPESILGRKQLRLDESHEYTIKVLRNEARPSDDLVTLSIDRPNDKEISIPLSLFQPQTAAVAYGLSFGHPAGPGVAEAEWEDLMLTVTRPPRNEPLSIRPKTAYVIDHRRQLFIDHFLIDKLEQVERIQGETVKSADNPVLRRERPWEAARCELYGSAIWNPTQKQIEMFYSASPAPYEAKLALAISKDQGQTWNRPEFNLFPWAGKPTNIVRPGRYWTHGPCVLFDPQDADSSRRYKLFLTAAPVAPVGDDKESEGQRGIDVAYSPDGIHWTSEPSNPVIAGLNSDTGNCVIWDEACQRYRAYIRIRCNVGRSVGLTESKDFINWSEPKTIYTPTSFDSQFQREYYGLSVTKYEGLYLGLIWIFPNTPESANRESNSAVTWVELVVSRDGEKWERPFLGQEFIPLGPTGRFDSRQIRPASSMTVLDDRVVIMYSGSAQAHVAGHNWEIGMATLRQDGFAAIRATQMEGSVLTRPLIYKAGRLRINADVSAGGFLKVELLDSEGQVINGHRAADCQPITGDRLNAVAEWNGSPSLPASGPSGTRLRFTMKNARLYSYQVTP